MMRKHVAIGGAMIIPMVAVSILGVGWADHVAIPEGTSEEYQEIFDKRVYMPEATGSTESEYGDCTISYVTNVPSPGMGEKIDMSMDCGVGYGGGGGGGGDERLFNLLMPNFDGPRDGITWEQTGIEFCSIQTVNHARHPGHGPNTLSINIDCWWMDNIITLNTTGDDRPVEELAAESVHAILGVVTKINTVPYNVTMANATSVNATSVNGTDTVRGTIFTEVTVAVNEDLRGTYDAGLIMFRFEGGSIGDTRIINPDAPAFDLGEQVLVLVGEPDPDGYYPIVGQVNGKYGVFDGLAIVGLYDRYNPYYYDEPRVNTMDELRELFEDVQHGQQMVQDTDP